MDRSIGHLFVPLMKHGFVCAGGVRLFRVERGRGTVQMWDGDCRRALRRGTPLVEVKVQQLCELLRDEVSAPEIFYSQEGGDDG